MRATTDQPSGSYRAIVSACTVLATLMQALDTTIANVALPYMQGSFAAAPDQITWVLTSYIVAAAIMTAPVGWLSARFGRKTLFIACLAGFTFASVLCGLANSLDQMVMFRLLQGAFGAGLVMAPRGAGTMIAMLAAGRLVNHVDPRLLMFAGFVLLAESARQMVGWTPDIGPWSFTLTTLIQGAGLGLVFTPLQIVAFATLPSALRTDGTALFSLVRNVGSSIGVSVASFLLEQNTQIEHAALAGQVTPFNRMLQSGGAYLYWNSATQAGLGALNDEITRQASIIAYMDDFKLMLMVSLPAVLLLFLMQWPGSRPAAPGDVAVAE